MRSTIISLGLFNHTGGPTKTVGDFKRALDAGLYAFCEHRSLKCNELAVPGACPVASTRLPIFSHFCYTRNGAAEAEAIVRQSSIVSCHGFYRYHALWTHKICRAAAVPYFFVPHGVLDPWVMRNGRWVKQLYWGLGGQRFLKEAATVIFSTRAERDKAVSQFDLPGSEVVPWAVELVDLVNREERRTQVRKKLRIPAEARVLLYFGRVHSIKRPLETIKAIAKANVAETHLIIVGNEYGVTKEDCMQLARKLNVEKCVHFIGPVYGEAKYDYMHAADAYISLSYKENFNYTAAESLAAGLPVILSPGNDLSGEVSDIGCSFNIQDNSLQSAAKVICDFNDMSLPTLQDMGSRGRKWVGEHLNFDLFRTRLIKLHERYMKKHY